MSLPPENIAENSRNNILVTHALLTGLTPLVPIPLVDDYLYAYFMRSMVQRMGALHGKPLTNEGVRVLTDQPSRGCALGCLSQVLLYPIKKVLRKIFFFLEWKRAVDTISHAYYQGYLTDAALAEGWIEAHGALKVRTAIDTVLARTNTSLFTRAISGVVNQSKGILQGAGELLTRSLSGTKAAHGQAAPGQDEVAQAAASVQAEEEAKLGNLTSQLQRAIATLPGEHFQQLRHDLAKELTL